MSNKKYLNRDYKDYEITMISKSTDNKNNQEIKKINLNQGSRL